MKYHQFLSLQIEFFVFAQFNCVEHIWKLRDEVDYTK